MTEIRPTSEKKSVWTGLNWHIQTSSLSRHAWNIHCPAASQCDCAVCWRNAGLHQYVGTSLPAAPHDWSAASVQRWVPPSLSPLTEPSMAWILILTKWRLTELEHQTVLIVMNTLQNVGKTDGKTTINSWLGALEFER